MDRSIPAKFHGSAGRVALGKPASYATQVPAPACGPGPKDHTVARASSACAPFLAAVLACVPSPEHPATRVPAARPPGEPVGRPTTNDERLDPAEVRAHAARILQGIAAARKLELRADVAVDVIDKPGIRAFARQTMYEHTTPEELRMHGRIEASLGVIPPGVDPEKIILDLLEDGVLGLYDPKRKTLFVGDFVPKPMLTMVVGHEIAHGLQDMHFDLKAMQEPIDHQSDAESARRFLVEGEAQAAYLAYVSGPDGLAAIDERVLVAMGDQALGLASAAAPYPIVARSLQMPYSDGTATVLRLVKQNGWSAVDALYRDLPRTTEQMLHIDKLLAREPAVPARMDPAAFAGAKLRVLWEDDLGEAALLSMLAESGDPPAARAAAAGWGGDRYVALDREGEPLPVPVVAGVITWDSEGDAEQFVAAFAPYLASHALGGHVLDRRGKLVVYATGLDPALDVSPTAVKHMLWRGAKVGP